MDAPVRIDSIEQLDQIVQASGSRPVLLFKHSTRCEVSAWAYQEFLSFAATLSPGGALPAVVLVVESRPISNEVALRFGVPHQSPQAIVIAQGRAIWNESHQRITARSLNQAIAQAA